MRCLALTLLFAAGAPGAYTAGASSDLLIVLGEDGLDHLAQHTLSSEGALIVLALPGSVDADHVRFSGPERATFAAAQRRRPGRLALWSGSAFVRYRHRYDETLASERDGVRSLRVASVPPRLTVEDGELDHSSVTWVLPEGFEALPGDAVAPTRGRWVRDGRLLRFEQRGAVPIDLTLRYRRVPAGPDSAACLAAAPDSDACASDRDADGVPDRRDVCLPDEPPSLAPAPATPDVDAFGCGRVAGVDDVLPLAGIAFENGQSYLDVNARLLLDRLAAALTHAGGSGVHEIVAHAGDVGPGERRVALSTERARAVRHYLVLRGVGPNRLRATGTSAGGTHGSETPTGDRVELRRLRDPAPETLQPAQ